jgi:hypothetical protein
MSREKKIGSIMVWSIVLVFGLAGLLFIGASLCVIFKSIHPIFGGFVLLFGLIFCSFSIFFYKIEHGGIKIDSSF